MKISLPTQNDLYDQDGSVVAELVDAFSFWLTAAREDGLIKEDSSVRSYEDIWRPFATWCLSQNPAVRLGDLTPVDIELFVASRTGTDSPDAELSTRYVWRVLTLIDRVLTHQAKLHGGRVNESARQVLNGHLEWRHANAAAKDPLPTYLDAGQAKILVDFLSSARPRPGRQGGAYSWQEVRNRSAVALQLGAGVTPAEVRALTVQSLISVGGTVKGLPWKIQVPANGNSAGRETPVAQWAAYLLKHWLTVRREMGIAGDFLYPSTRTGKPWGKVAQYGAVIDVLDASGVDKSLIAGGSFRLRHTFALRQLRRGKSPEDVAGWLGVVDPDVMARYKRVLSAPVTDLA